MLNSCVLLVVYIFDKINNCEVVQATKLQEMHSNTGSETDPLRTHSKHCIESDSDDSDDSFAVNREFSFRREAKLALEVYMMKCCGCGEATNRVTTSGIHVEFVCAGAVERHFIIKDGRRIGAGMKLRVPQGFVEPVRQPNESETQYQRRRSNGIRKAAACPFRAILRRKLYLAARNMHPKRKMCGFSVYSAVLVLITFLVQIPAPPRQKYHRKWQKS